MDKSKHIEKPIDEQTFLDDLCQLVSGARAKAFAAINYSLVERNWNIGRRIIEQEQQGNARAEYGKRVITLASQKLTSVFGKGFSVTNIKNFRSFYLKFSNLQIGQTVSDLSVQIGQAAPDLLPWTHKNGRNYSFKCRSKTHDLSAYGRRTEKTLVRRQ